jgi:hypothetical protein
MIRYWMVLLAVFSLTLSQIKADEPETMWLEAEHFTGIKGYCWPMGDDTRQMRQTNGNWGMSGPGWAAEWNQGGESGFLSIASGANEQNAIVTRAIDVPAGDPFELWVRYADWREQPEEFEIRIRQPNEPGQVFSFGQIARREEDNEMKLYWGWAFAWDHVTVKLKPGPAVVEIVAAKSQPVPRQVDVVVLTTDREFSPLIKDRPRDTSTEVLEHFRAQGFDELPPLARRNLVGDISMDDSESNSLSAWSSWQPPEPWRIRTMNNEGFLYLWNVSHTDPATTWLGDDPNRVLYPYNIIDADTRTEFEATYGGKIDVPIFSDDRIAPVFHTVGAGIFQTDAMTGEVTPAGKKFAEWLDRNPQKKWGTMMNYHPGAKVGPAGISMFERYRGRYVGSVAGESLGYFDPNPAEMAAATANSKTRRELVSAFAPVSLASNSAKYRAIYDRDLDANPYADVISCHSIESLAFTPICLDWGARTVGYESSAATSTLLALRWAAMRGGARQYERMTATYRSCNFGDSSTIFSKASSFSSVENILDNYYSAYSGAGMTWYKFDLWHQYMSGSSMFYHEQGFDEFWKPGGTTAAGHKPVELSPKGKLVDRFLRITREHPDRGTPVTPIAFLIDHAHGWEPAPFWPNSFGNWHQHPDRFLHSDHEQMLQQWMWTAYHPIGPQSERAITGVNEVFVTGLFGDIFDCMFAVPDVSRWKNIDTYPVVIALGELELTPAEADRLRQYVEQGGTLLISADQVSAEVAALLQLPAVTPVARAKSLRWSQPPSSASPVATPEFEFQPINVMDVANSAPSGWKVLAATDTGDCYCATADRGNGRIVYLSIPKGLTLTRQLHPIVPHLIARLTRDQMPLEVSGEVEWMLNRTSNGWLLTLLNPAGQDKPQQGITPTDYRQSRLVKVKARFPVTPVSDWLAPGEVFWTVEPQNRLQIQVPAGSVRIVELR